VRAIQTAVIVMGVMIVLGVAFIGVEIFRRATDPNHPRSWVADRAAPGGPAPPVEDGPAAMRPRPQQPNQALLAQGAAEREAAEREAADRDAEPVTLPAGSEIGAPAGAGDRVVFRVVLPDGTQQMHVLDPRTGQISVPLTAPPAPAGARPAR
jgi:hypothetical protein